MPETCCCVPECSNRGGHVFPSDPLRKISWIHAIKRGETRFQSWEPSTHAVVCRAHFKEEDYVTETSHGTTPLNKRLKKNAIPSVFSWVEPSPHSAARANRAKSRGVKRKLAEEFSASNDSELIYCTESDDLQTVEEIVSDSSVIPEESIVQDPNIYFRNVQTQRVMSKTRCRIDIDRNLS
ncbi:THAP domain-containing protein 3-like [Saccostrea cucullata]|uniref:THAP domain-containing protein 3-like n=1 Tax=Saccostrea cuccullata TaxID=36930 RepID=UPI002ED20429